ncbi:MAG: hypothetical protein C4308_00020 [Chitinophagaceae bacterium]
MRGEVRKTQNVLTGSDFEFFGVLAAKTFRHRQSNPSICQYPPLVTNPSFSTNIAFIFSTKKYHDEA